MQKFLRLNTAQLTPQKGILVKVVGPTTGNNSGLHTAACASACFDQTLYPGSTQAGAQGLENKEEAPEFLVAPEARWSMDPTPKSSKSQEETVSPAEVLWGRV